MRESLNDAIEELKRVDHLIYVTLKYTRTTDVIRSIIERLTGCIDALIKALLLQAKKRKKLEELPASPGARAALVRALYTDEKIQEMIEFYTLLRRLYRANYTKTEEYRRHVALNASLEEGIVKVDIDKVSEFHEKTKEFLDCIFEMIEGKK